MMTRSVGDVETSSLSWQIANQVRFLKTYHILKELNLLMSNYEEGLSAQACNFFSKVQYQIVVHEMVVSCFASVRVLFNVFCILLMFSTRFTLDICLCHR